MSQGLVIEITENGKGFLTKNTMMGQDFSNEIHLLSELVKTKNGRHYPNWFEQFNYKNPSLHRCRAYLVKNGYTIEHY